MSNQVTLIDYGVGNLCSVQRALEACGAQVELAQTPEALLTAQRLLLPGVGGFSRGMQSLQEGGWVEPLRHIVAHQQVPLLGICLGMHLLADVGQEGGDTLGLGLIPGTVSRLIPQNPEERIPHVGWNEVYPKKISPLWQDIPEGTDFYFVHSYHFAPAQDENRLAVTPYCGQFCSAVQHNNIFGVQFHPEKSAKAGLKLIQNFLELSHA